jgi:phospholipase C
MRPSAIGAVEHIVFMMEKRSYDHYFGAYPLGCRFGDHPAGSLGVFAESYLGAGSLVPPNVLLPFDQESTAPLGPATSVLGRGQDGQLRVGPHFVDVRGRR